MTALPTDSSHRSRLCRPPPDPPLPDQLREGEDFYREGESLIFTAAYHFRRGTCCNSGCRHCPFPPRPAAEAIPGPVDE